MASIHGPIIRFDLGTFAGAYGGPQRSDHEATDFASVITLANELRAALVEKGPTERAHAYRLWHLPIPLTPGCGEPIEALHG